MPDYVTMQNRIALEAFFVPSAADSGRQSEIRNAIQTAITAYENELFWFNEQQATSTTVAGFEYYTLPSDFIQMYSLARMSDDFTWQTLEALSFDEIEEMNSSGRLAKPQYYCTFNEQLRLSPIPDVEYELRLSYLKSLPVVTADTDTTAWTNEAEPLIRAQAKAVLFLDVTHDPEQAQMHDQVASMWFRKLQRRTVQWIGTEQLRPQVF